MTESYKMERILKSSIVENKKNVTILDFSTM